MGQESKLLKSKMFWVGILYFAEGFPYGMFYDVFPVYFRQQGVDLKTIGLLGLLGLVWSLKFVWAPAVDYFRHHRRWIFCMDVLMGGILLMFASQLHDSSWGWMVFWLFLFALFSATSDIAIDGYTIELLDKRELGLANGIRIAVYRVGILGSGFVLILSGQFSWALGYLVGGLILCLFGSLCLAAPREKEYQTGSLDAIKSELIILLRHPGGMAVVYLFFLCCLWLLDTRLAFSSGKPYFGPVLLMMTGGAALASYLYVKKWNRANNSLREELNQGPLFGAVFELIQRPAIIPLVLFILSFKLGDTSMGFMVKPFWVDSGFSATEIGLISVNIGLGLSIAGGLVGGWFTDRFGIFKGLWVLGLLQAVSNLGYAAAAMIIPAGDGPVELIYRVMIYGASMVESFTGGLGNGPFLAFLMSIVNKQRAASEYALLSSIFALSRQVSYWASGYGAQSMGYAAYFALTFFLAFPAYLLLPWVKRTLNSQANDAQNG